MARLLIEYDGAGFVGWARQPGLRTVQGELEAVLARIRGEDVPLTVAGRTDRGVHAWGQVASHAGPPIALRSLNALLPGDVAVRASVAAPEAFDARRDATSRTYCYRIWTGAVARVFERGRELHWHRPIERAALDACAALLTGLHDFTAFTPTITDHVRFERRVLDARWRADGDRLEFWIEADAYMRHMNRVLVGTMLDVARGQRTVEGFAALLEGRPRRDAGPTAPPHGLALASVTYGGELPWESA